MERNVTPRVGVWIEIKYELKGSGIAIVTPRVGVWIEIPCADGTGKQGFTSLPVWECGLKFMMDTNTVKLNESLPVWECGLKYKRTTIQGEEYGHSPCGSVD